MIKFKNRVFNDYEIDFANGHIINNITNEILEQFFIKNSNYLHVKIKTKKNRTRMIPVHNIICHTYYGFKEGFEVHHVNEIKTDNRIENLVYITHNEHSGITGANNFKKVWDQKRQFMLKCCSDAGKKSMKNATKEFHSKGGKAGYFALENYWTPEKRKQMGKKTSVFFKNMIWITDGIKNKRVPKENVDQWIKNGFYPGRSNFHKKH